MLNSTKFHVDAMMRPQHRGSVIRRVAHQVITIENTSDERGLPSQKLVYKTEKPLESFDSFKVDDFSVLSLTAAGAVNLLKPVMLHQSFDGSVDNVEKALDFIDEAEQVLNSANAN